MVRFRGHDAAVNAVSFAADDQVVVSAGYDRAVKFWDVRSNSIDAIQSVCAWKDSVTSLAITRNHCVTAASVDGSIRTMDLRAGRATADALGSEHPITSVRASGDERCFLLSVLGGRCVLLGEEIEQRACGGAPAERVGRAGRAQEPAPPQEPSPRTWAARRCRQLVECTAACLRAALSACIPPCRSHL